MRRLHAWQNGTHIGTFHEDDDGSIGFEYDRDDADGMPISLSLPRSGLWDEGTPRSFLDNLLPDNPNVREAMRTRLHTASADMFDLLDGVDATGGLTFTLSSAPPSAPPTLSLATDGEIAAEIRRISRTRNIWWDENGRCRFSLGGAQGKFTLTRIGGQWFWPDAALPSTHIVKPEPHDAEHAAAVEHATMAMARACGIPVPPEGVIDAEGERAFLVERFDRRASEDGRLLRIRQEDFPQAMGRPAADKYDVTADDCIRMLRRAGHGDGLVYEWLERLAFNTAIADSDAHAKNYSLLLDPSTGIRLAPAYDLVATRYWVRFDQELAMPIRDDDEFAEWTTPESWRDLARRNLLDEDRVVDMARRTAGKVLSAAEGTIRELGIDPAVGQRLLECWHKANEAIRPIPPAAAPEPPSGAPPTATPVPDPPSSPMNSPHLPSTGMPLP